MKLDKYQKYAVNNIGSIAVNAGAGCVSGDTIIQIVRAKNSTSITIKVAYEKFNSIKGSCLSDVKTQTRSLQEGIIKLHDINDIVYSGKKLVYELTLDNGFKLKATYDHKVMTIKGYVELGKLKKTDYVMCDALKAEKSDTIKPRRNEPSNLICVTKEDNRKLHRSNRYPKFPQSIPKYSSVISIKRIGVVDTYDIVCKDPYRNFVANGIVIHNSGKSRCLEQKVVKLINDNVSPSKITVCSFTKDSAKDIQNRIAASVGEDIARRIKSGTIHSIAYKLYISKLRKNNLNHIKPNIISDGLKYIQISTIIKSFKLDDIIRGPVQFYNFLDKWQSEGLSANAVLKLNPQFKKVDPSINSLYASIKIYLEYTKFLNKNNMFDFGTLLVEAYEYLLDEKNLTRESRKVEHMLVDECFTGDTFIALKGGKKTKIINLYNYTLDYKKLPEVKTYNEITKKIEYKKIKRVFRNKTQDELIKIRVDSMAIIKATKNHKIYTSNRGWVEARNIKIGDLLLLDDRTGNRLMTDMQKSLLLAAHIGQGAFKKHNGYIRMVYSANKFISPEYIKWKSSLLSPKMKNVNKHTQQAGNPTRRIETRTIYCDCSFDYLLDYMSPLTLSVLVCDNIETYNKAITIISFKGIKDYELLWKFVDKIKDLFDLNPSVERHRLGYPILVFRNEETIKLSKVVRGYVPEFKAHRFYNYDYNKYPLIIEKSPRTSIRAVNKITTISCNEDYLYDLEVADNHNYFVSVAFTNKTSMLVHNCHDVNNVQFKIIELLSSKHLNTYLYFDLRQAIYSFRYAVNNNLKDFIRRNNIPIYDMPNNYRSCKKIVALGNRLMSQNKSLVPAIAIKNCDGKIYASNSESEYAEAEKVFDFIEMKLNEGYKPKDIAIIYRINSQSRSIVDVSIERDIPINVPEKNSFYSRQEVKDIIAYFSIAINPHKMNYNLFKRIYNKPNRYISAKTMELINKYSNKKDVSFFRALKSCSNIPSINSKQLSNIAKFVADIEKLYKINTYSSISLLNTIYNVLGYKEFIIDKSKDSADAITEDILDSIQSFAKKYNTPLKFVRYFRSLRKKKNRDIDSIDCHTIHSIKGIEYTVCIIMGVSEGILPHRKSNNIDEEMRMLYVGITRAKKELLISTINGKYGRYNVTTSRFLKQINFKVPNLTVSE